MRNRLDVAEEGRVRHERANARFDFFRELVRLLDRPAVGHEQME